MRSAGTLCRTESLVPTGASGTQTATFKVHLSITTDWQASSPAYTSQQLPLRSLVLDGPRGCGPIFCIQIQVQILAQLWCGLLDEEPRVSSEKFNLSGHFHFLEVNSYPPEKAYK